MGKKLVSVIVPAYNSGEFIEESLRTILSQTWEAIEILVGDNASSDDTEALVRNMMALDSRIKYFKHEVNIGYSKNCNKLIEEAKGGYICIYHSDDLYDPRIIEKQVEVLDSNEGVIGCFTNFSPMNSDGSEAKDKKPYSYSSNSVLVDHDYFIEKLLEERYNPIFCPSSMIRKNAYRKVGGYTENLNIIFDQDMWVRLLALGNFIVLNEELVKYRFHDKQLSYVYRDPEQVVVSPMVSHIETYLKGYSTEYDCIYREKIERLYAADFVMKAFLSVGYSEYSSFSAMLNKSKEYYLFSGGDHKNYSKIKAIQRLPVVCSYVICKIIKLILK